MDQTEVASVIDTVGWGSMARRKSGPIASWFVAIFTGIVLIPKNVWIVIGIGVLVALVAYAFIKWQRQKKTFPAAIDHQPTLAELTAKASPSPPKAIRPARNNVAAWEGRTLSATEKVSQQPLASQQAQAASNLHASARYLHEAKDHAASQPFKQATSALAPSLNILSVSSHQSSMESTAPRPSMRNSGNLHEAMSAVDEPKAASANLSASEADVPPRESPKIVVVEQPHWRSAESNLASAREQETDNPYSPPTSVLPPPPPLHDEWHSASGGGEQTREFLIPKPPKDIAANGRWVGPEEVIVIADTTIKGGLFYTGTHLKMANGYTEPSLVRPWLPVAAQGSCQTLDSGCWNGYVGLSATERRAYLTWLATGRSDPSCAPGYVLLFLFGLEHRVMLDGRNEPASKQEWPCIRAEIEKLDEIYGERDEALRIHLANLLDWMVLDAPVERLYEKPLPPLSRRSELPIYLRLALGQCVEDRIPIPAALALAWVRLNSEIFLRTPATRCVDEFDQLFTLRYHESFGTGLSIPKNKTKLKFACRPASPAFYGIDVTRTFDDTPDVTTLAAPVKKLHDLAELCTDELSSYSRLVGKDPEAGTKIEGLLLLPHSIWPDRRRQALQSILNAVQDTPKSMSVGQLADRLGGAQLPLNRDKIRDFAKLLENFRVGMEPNVLEGARVPGEDDPIVLFAMLPDQTHQPDSAAYQTALLTLQLASTVAQSDGRFSDEEAAHLGQEIDGWNHVSKADQRRLRAHLEWLRVAPITMAAVKKKLEPLDLSAKEAVAASMATLARIDGLVSPEEMRFLEKVYKALGVEAKRIFSDFHPATGAKTEAQRATPSGKRFKLDPKRIAQVEQETAKTCALLANIFVEDVPEPAPGLVPTPSETAPPPVESMLGLDQAHSDLLRLMLSRPSWTRAELKGSASNLDLMLDGAIEQINDASFDAFNIPFAEGDDPVQINAEFIESIKQ
jgi:tellurite resistance protein